MKVPKTRRNVWREKNGSELFVQILSIVRIPQLTLRLRRQPTRVNKVNRFPKRTDVVTKTVLSKYELLINFYLSFFLDVPVSHSPYCKLELIHKRAPIRPRHLSSNATAEFLSRNS